MQPEPAVAPGRLGTIDGLRGFAAFAVAWFHFTNGAPLLPDGWFKSSGQYGWLGVEIFFVISGFIIPHALHRAGYQGRDFGLFLVKRIARLDPPYVASIVLVVGLSYAAVLAPGSGRQWPEYGWAQLLGHLAYINSIVGKPWVNPVYWSLGIEFQYYLMIGALFPLLVHRCSWIRFGFLAGLVLSGVLVPRTSLVFVWFPLFVTGILTFQRKAELMSGGTWLASVGVTGTICWFVNGPPVAVVVVATALVIQFVRIPCSRLTDLGLISYSLYLLHVPVGGKIVNLGARVAHSFPAQLLVVAAALAGSIAASVAFYRWIELPSQRLSASVRYRSRRGPEPAPATPVPGRVQGAEAALPPGLG
jgi:peptidoglycan/LPS O-acetylase OafA/YrhL